MREAEYSEAAVEVLDILNHTNKEDAERIPQSFIKFLADISSKNYKPQFNHEQPVNGLNLRKKTKELLGFIYITWWCDENDRKKYKNIIYSSNSKTEKIENYNAKDIFKNKKETQIITVMENVKETSISIKKQDNLYKRFISKIFSFLKK